MIKRNKFNAVLVKADGHTFQSKAEHKRYCELKILERGCEISDLKVHPKFPIFINNVKVCDVLGDLEYIENGKWIVEDVKGQDTAMSRFKRKLVKAAYPSVDWRVIKT